MRIRLTKLPPAPLVDGFDVREYRAGLVGETYEVHANLARYLIAAGYAEHPKVGQKAVLVVDDDGDVRTMLNHVLAFAGFAVIEATNGSDALVALVKHRPALIILDLMMPGMDGEHFRQAQRRLQDHELANVPILVVSGADNAKQMAQTLGAAGIFEKPLDLDRILTAVQARVST